MDLQLYRSIHLLNEWISDSNDYGIGNHNRSPVQYSLHKHHILESRLRSAHRDRPSVRDPTACVTSGALIGLQHGWSLYNRSNIDSNLLIGTQFGQYHLLHASSRRIVLHTSLTKQNDTRHWILLDTHRVGIPFVNTCNR